MCSPPDRSKAVTEEVPGYQDIGGKLVAGVNVLACVVVVTKADILAAMTECGGGWSRSRGGVGESGPGQETSRHVGLAVWRGSGWWESGQLAPLLVGR